MVSDCKHFFKNVGFLTNNIKWNRGGKTPDRHGVTSGKNYIVIKYKVVTFIEN